MEDNDSIFEIEPEGTSKRSIAEEFEEERKKWKDKVIEMANKVNKLDQVAGLQVDLYSSRQIIIERISKLYQYLALYNTTYKTQKRDLFLKYTIDSDIKLGQGEKIIMVDGDLADLQKN